MIVRSILEAPEDDVSWPRLDAAFEPVGLPTLALAQELHATYKRIARLAERGRPDAALAQLESLERHCRGDATDIIRARLLSRAGRWTESVAAWEAILRWAPDAPEALFSLGVALREMGELRQAENALRRATTLEPENVHAQFELARVYHSTRRICEAYVAYSTVLQLQPGHISAIAECIRMLWLMLRERDAETRWRSAVEYFGGSAAGHISLAAIACRIYRPGLADHHIATACSLANGDHSFRERVARFYLDIGRLDKAREHGHEPTVEEPGTWALSHAVSSAASDLSSSWPTPLDRGAAGKLPTLLPEYLFDMLIDRLLNRSDTPTEAVGRRVVVHVRHLVAGGAERQAINTVLGLQARTSEVSEAFMLFEPPLKDADSFYRPLLRDISCHAREIRFQFDEMQLGDWNSILNRLPKLLRDRIARVYAELVRLRPEVVHTWNDTCNISGAIAAALAGVPRIVMSGRNQRPDVHVGRRVARRFERDAYRALLRLPGVLLTSNSRAGATDFADWLDIDPASISVIPNAFSECHYRDTTDLSEAEDSLRRAGFDPRASVVGGIFRLVAAKRPLLWLEVAAAVLREVPDACFVMIGEGPGRSAVEKHAGALGISDRLHLRGNTNNVGGWLQLMDVFLLTSVVEGLPNVLIEAQAFGVPVISTNAGGARETFVHGATGWLADGDEPESIAERVIWSLREQRWRREAAGMARRHVRERFTMDRMIEKTLTVYGLAGN